MRSSLSKESAFVIAEVIPLLLSTMRLPEMEALENHLLQDHETSATTKGLVYYEQLGVSNATPPLPPPALFHQSP